MEVQPILELIKDGKWHEVDKIARKLEVSSEEILALAKTLQQLKLVEFDQGKNKIKLISWVRRLLASLHVDNDKEVTCSIILPPKTSIKIQDSSIGNLTKSKLELCLRVNRGIKELAISLFT